MSLDIVKNCPESVSQHKVISIAKTVALPNKPVLPKILAITQQPVNLPPYAESSSPTSLDFIFLVILFSILGLMVCFDDK